MPSGLCCRDSLGCDLLFGARLFWIAVVACFAFPGRSGLGDVLLVRSLHWKPPRKQVVLESPELLRSIVSAGFPKGWTISKVSPIGSTMGKSVMAVDLAGLETGGMGLAQPEAAGVGAHFTLRRWAFSQLGIKTESSAWSMVILPKSDEPG